MERKKGPDLIRIDAQKSYGESLLVRLQHNKISIIGLYTKDEKLSLPAEYLELMEDTKKGRLAHSQRLLVDQIENLISIKNMKRKLRFIPIEEQQEISKQIMNSK